jgi:iron complex outermembrane receptor protein
MMGGVAGRIHGYNLIDTDYALSTYNNQQWVLGRP